MTIGPFSIGCCALGGELAVVAVHLIEQHLARYDALTEAGCGQRVFGVLLFGGASGIGGGLLGHGFGIGSQQIHRLVKQRNIRPGQR